MALRFALVLFAGFVCGSSLHAQAPAGLRTDSLGDPLPPGAVARLGTLRLKHYFENPKAGKPKSAISDSAMSRIDAVIFSRDGKKIASKALPGPTIRLWDRETGKELAGPSSGNRSSLQAG